jgi:ribonuclease HI
LFVAELQMYGAFVAENKTDSTKIINAVAETWQGYWKQIIWRGNRPASAINFLRKLKRSAKGERDERAKRAKQKVAAL